MTRFPCLAPGDDAVLRVEALCLVLPFARQESPCETPGSPGIIEKWATRRRFYPSRSEGRRQGNRHYTPNVEFGSATFWSSNDMDGSTRGLGNCDLTYKIVKSRKISSKFRYLSSSHVRSAHFG